jgi:lipid-A-disaccharide synthase-like uncharacterized protein
MIAEILSFKILGYLGGALYLGSWLLQAYETKKADRVTVSARFFAIRSLGALFLVVECIRVASLSLLLVNGLTCVLMSYNLLKCLEKKQT